MPQIDDPIEQARRQWLSDVDPFANTLTSEVVKKGFPILGAALSLWQSREQRQVLLEFNNWVLDYLKQLDQRIDQLYERMTLGHKRIAALAVERILWGAPESKAKRFAAVVAHELVFGKDAQELEDAASFIRALDELSEDDIRVLKHLYNHQKDVVLENYTIDYNTVVAAGRRIEKLLRDATNLGIQMDDFYARNARLSGYGLVLPLERNTNFNPSEYGFRITLQGKRLMEMLIKTGRESTDVKKSQG